MSSRAIAERFEEPLLESRRDKRNDQKDNDSANMQPRQAMIRQQANTVVAELGQQKLLRAIYSERQLQEVLTDFWFNHFNVDARKGPERFMLTEYEREAIRPHVLGKFRDLLEATAKSPAMLFYLDNWMSADPNGPHADVPPPRIARGPFGGIAVVPRPPRPRPQGKNAPKGLNENYGRELMELHTLGVDGGYTQKDVTEVARAFTGWTIDRPRTGGGFRFEPRLHDPGAEGRARPRNQGRRRRERRRAGARHPREASFDRAIHLDQARAPVRRAISRRAPLVDKAAKRFQDTGGDIREVMRTILLSPEFLAPEAYRAKVKTPFEFVVSAVRATGAEVDDALPLVRALQQLGMPLYQCQPPTGYKDTADAWVNTGALVSRMNFAVQLTSSKLPGITPSTLDRLTSAMADDVSETTKATIARATTAPQAAALTLGAPEFQKR